MDILVNLLNQFFTNCDTSQLVKKFVLSNGWIDGQIRVHFKETTLYFDVKVPLSFPFGYAQTCIRFINTDLKGYPHVNADGSICLHSEPCTDVTIKLKNEYDLLKNWISIYYMDEKEDVPYQYLQIPMVSSFHTMLFMNSKAVFQKYSCGFFDYKSYNQAVHIVQNIGKWTLNSPSNNIWVYIEKEPIIQRRQVVENWKQLEKYLCQKNLQLIFDCKKKMDTRKSNQAQVFVRLLLGYSIPTESGKSVHWELIHIHWDTFPIEFINQKTYKCLNQPILWQKTSNCSYERFFGRGKLSNELTDKKILLIGIGAIGSSLAKILVKGGCKQLTLIDFDVIESGNICRAEYPLHHTSLSKVESLRHTLTEISPFVQVDIALTIGKALPNMPEFKPIKQRLNHFDIIFDCSTDNEMVFMLDEMELPAKIFNLSITDKAQEFICITNPNISIFKHYVASSFHVQPPTLYVGAGCQYPTFEASYLDINALLFNALKYIQYLLENKLFLKSFTLERDELDLKVYPFETYQLIDSPLKLMVSKKWIDYIKNQSIQHFPNEFGGILIGYYVNDTTLFVSKIFTPKQISTSPNAYTRYVEDVNAYLETIYHQTDGALVYVGEWHSHPNSSSVFSEKDFKTMQNIANNSNTNNKNPILLINGFNIQQHDISIYIFKQNKLLKYEKV